MGDGLWRGHWEEVGRLEGGLMRRMACMLLEFWDEEKGGGTELRMVEVRVSVYAQGLSGSTLVGAVVFLGIGCLET